MKESRFIYLHRIRSRTAYLDGRIYADRFNTIGYSLGVVALIGWIASLGFQIWTLFKLDRFEWAIGVNFIWSLVGLGTILLWFFTVSLICHIAHSVFDIADSNLDANKNTEIHSKHQKESAS